MASRGPILNVINYNYHKNKYNYVIYFIPIYNVSNFYNNIINYYSNFYIIFYNNNCNDYFLN